MTATPREGWRTRLPYDLSVSDEGEASSETVSSPLTEVPRPERTRSKRRRRRIGAAVAVVLAAAVALAVFFGVSSPTSPRLSSHRHADSLGARGKSSPAARIFLGPDGVESSAVIAENRLPGTTAWQITSAPASGYIEGFADKNYAAAGDSVDLYVSTNASSFGAVAYRMGWYHGKGARQIWSSSSVPGVVQPSCPVDASVNMVSCDNWSRSLTFSVTSAWVPGDYLLKLNGDGGQQAYVLLTVWDPASKATYLVMNRSLTEEAWNTYGGYDFYQGEGPCILDSDSYPVCNRARVVSFDRPTTDGNGSSDFLGNEYPLVRYSEQHGLDVTYATDITIDEHPNFVLQHRALLSLGHDEVWTYSEREAAETAFHQGVNMVFFGAAAVLRHARLQASPLGPDREEVDYRNSSEDPLNSGGDPTQVTGNTWSSPPTNLSETGFVGEVYAGYTLPGKSAVPFVVADASAWIFKGTGLQNGSSVPGVILSDIDHLDSGAQMPQNIEVLGHSPVPLSVAYTNQGQWGGNTYADATYYTDPTSHAGVFDSGTVNWINSIAECPGPNSACVSGPVGQITGNLMWLFGQGPAGNIQPSTANWQTITPPGS
jgi:N,N-dimethylformamidase beta subunit-like, C-terminal